MELRVRMPISANELEALLHRTCDAGHWDDCTVVMDDGAGEGEPESGGGSEGAGYAEVTVDDATGTLEFVKSRVDVVRVQIVKHMDGSVGLCTQVHSALDSDPMTALDVAKMTTEVMRDLAARSVKMISEGCKDDGEDCEGAEDGE